MELKTRVKAEDGRQELFIYRDFDISVSALFDAYTKAAFVAEWMGTNVIQLDQFCGGAYRFETTDPKGNVHRFSGSIHEQSDQKRLVRTFQMIDTDFPAQLEFLEFEAIDEQSSRLTIQVVYQSVAVRDAILKLPFVQGINAAHNRLEALLIK